GGIVRLWDFTGEGTIPSEEALEIALADANHPIEIQSFTDSLNRNTDRKDVSVTIIKNRNTILDLGGLGKGIAAEGAAKALDTIPEIQRYIIDLGGNIAVGGKGEKPFVIGIRDPKAPDDVIAKFQLEPGMACATAGDYQRFFEHDGVRYHHIIDPKTGRPAGKLSAVTVKATDAATADILSTALFVMGYDEGIGFLKNNPSVRAAFFGSEGKHIGGNLEIEAVR
ncbi:MAG: FAD:protein FMN transferase, partial [bacterium]